jgi:hypothetical protein
LVAEACCAGAASLSEFGLDLRLQRLRVERLDEVIADAAFLAVITFLVFDSATTLDLMPARRHLRRKFY